MLPVLSLWLPILVSAMLVFLASSLIHMLLGYHAGDHRQLPDEEAVGTAMRESGVVPGQYVIPWASGAAAMKEPEYAQRMERGPVALITVLRPGPTNMGRILIAWLLLNLVVSIIAGYVASRGAEPGADFGDVFRFTATVAFVAYAVGSWSDSIWYGRKWSTTLKNTLDAVIYAALTGAVFSWLWPA